MQTRTIGALILTAGFVGMIYFFAVFDTSVQVPTTEILGRSIGGGRVNNIGLMNDRQNGLIMSGIVAIIGTILFVMQPARKREAANSEQPPEATPLKTCENCGAIASAERETCWCGHAYGTPRSDEEIATAAARDRRAHIATWALGIGIVLLFIAVATYTVLGPWWLPRVHYATRP